MSWLLDKRNEQLYLSICERAVKDERVFATFRNSEPFKLIVENSPLKSGNEYLACIKEQYPWLFDHFNQFETSDDVGMPETFEFDGIWLSPTTLRYIKTLGDLEKFFGNLEGKNIVEIGGGYGGLCKIIHDIYRPASYSILDLMEPLQLQKKFLSTFGIQINVSRENKVPIDLLIAMYSWSELDLKTQKQYLDDVISKAKNCYIMLNYEMGASYDLLKETFKGADIKDYNLFYDDSNTEYAPYNRFIIIKR